ncbi:MAG TPA: hypothetical protein VLT91_12055 [Rhizomicrobium sp.]|nr:hypothetical protein [Rhizomicrobium sp.]
MRLRQIALVARDIEPVHAALNAVFRLKIAFRDPGVGVFGLVNAVMPVGGDFLEIVQPVKDDASASRYLHRRGGDAGYMLIFQAPDALAHRDRLAARGIRLIARHDTPQYTFTHFHPGDFNGVLTSIDTEGDGTSWREPMGKWPPAGKSWKDHLAPDDILGIAGATVQFKDPSAIAQSWSELFEVERAGNTILFDNAEIRFVSPVDADGTGIVGIDIAVRDPAAILARAAKANMPAKDGAVRIGGVDFSPVKA